MNTYCRRSWVEIDLEALKHNVDVYKQHLKSPHEVMAVVKANAYGHGDVEVARCLQEAGIHHFAVSNVEEAVRLREHGIAGQILILGYTPIDCAEVLLAHDLTQAVVDEHYAAALSATGTHVTVQFAVDTGMNRIGLDAEMPEKCESIIRKYAQSLHVTGLFTHLCVADTDNDACNAFTEHQEALFEAVAARVRDLELPYVHCLNSAGGLWHDCQTGSLVRLGIILYGLKPDRMNKLPEGIRPVLTWKTVVSMVKTVQAGETIGYGRSYRATEARRIATLPTGYADGYNRLLSNRGFVLIHGCKAPLVGRICMDQMMVDVTDIEDVKCDDEVILLDGDTYTADDMAAMVDTIGYEIVCDISSRVTRVYI